MRLDIQMRKDRVVNIRFFFCVFIGLMIGIVIGKLFCVNNMSWLWVALFVGVISLVGVCVCVYACKTRKYNKRFNSRKSVSFVLLASAIGLVISSFVGFVLPLVHVDKFSHNDTFDGEVVISGKVIDYVDKEDTYTKFLLDECKVLLSDGSIEVEGCIVVYTSVYSKILLGDLIVVNCQLDKCDIDNDFSQIVNGIAYTTYINSNDIMIDGNDRTVKDSLHLTIWDLLSNNLSRDNAGIFYAVLFGDKHEMSNEISDMFSYAGIAHILAVSGLHVGVLVGLIWFVLDKFKINKYVKIVMFVIMMLVYAYLCNWAVSVCRAVIMAMCLAICKVFKKEYDILTSLSIAGIVILLLSPLSLFSISFQLSFMCIFSIISLAPAIKNILLKIKTPTLVASALSVSIAVNLAIVPISLNAFNEMSLLGVIVNIIIIPLFSITYILLFVGVILSLIFPFLSGVLVVPDMFLHLIKVTAMYISDIPLGVFKVFRVSYVFVAIMILAIFLLHFLMSKKWVKYVSVMSVMFLVVIGILLGNLPCNYTSGEMITAGQYNSNVVFIQNNDEVIMVGSDITCDMLGSIMKDVRLRKIDTIVAFDFQLNGVELLNEVVSKYNVNNVIVPERYESYCISESFDNVIYMSQEYSFNSFDIDLVDKDGEIVGIVMTNGDKIVIVPNINNSKSENKYLIDNCVCDNIYLIVNDESLGVDTGCDIEIINLQDIKVKSI